MAEIKAKSHYALQGKDGHVFKEALLTGNLYQFFGIVYPTETRRK
jgi:hypothetical protein